MPDIFRGLGQPRQHQIDSHHQTTYLPAARQDASTALRHSESGMIDSVLVTTGADGQKFVKMRVSEGAMVGGELHTGRTCGSRGRRAPRSLCC